MPTETITAATEAAEENVLLISPAPEELEKESAQETLSAEALVTVGAAEAAPTPLDNALTLGIWAALAVALIIMVIRRATRKAPAAPAAPVEEAPAVEAPVAPGAAGEVKLHNVEPKTAAMLMAIVADKLQKPLNELRFISIKEVE